MNEDIDAHQNNKDIKRIATRQLSIIHKLLSELAVKDRTITALHKTINDHKDS